ncbi:DNA cytosine methyltransferase [Acinetobacter courvalinii]|uniref:DNA cytosine methyltransferase n=1 Tax=Acinetobacter courvalinii TaxID=280147 RepID=UPI0021D11AEA|nr:DNA cytosine methyltransferase [Acinetobacter courvalinii]MCU4368282.1 DNA cytosine methyltransferase [Acinetobacter courvalinii]MCU4446652.1 DNA cytosine methyltransferase [Acinetobacter courvalinii]
MASYKFLDLFAGAGGLSEGFIQAGFDPVAHVEADSAACATLKTRQAFHWLKKNNKLQIYINYLEGHLSRQEFWASVPEDVLNAVINEFIGSERLEIIFNKVDFYLKGGNLDFIIGGPPCQAYSIIGRARGNTKDDPRNHLYIYYAKFIERYKPKYFVFENVLGLLSAKDAHGDFYFNKMKALFNSIGYSIDYKILNATEYGILQNRKRIILIGKKGVKKKNFYPDMPVWHADAIVWDILSDLPKIQAGEGNHLPCSMKEKYHPWLEQANIRTVLPVTWHQARPNTQQDLEIYRIAVDKWNKDKKRLNYNDLPDRLKSHKLSASFTDRFKVVAGDLNSAHTVIAHMAKDGHHYIHPDINQNRSLTPREAARLQTFPDDYFFESQSGKPSRTSAYKQIGNAVPVFLAYQIAKHLKRNLK